MNTEKGLNTKSVEEFFEEEEDYIYDPDESIGVFTAPPDDKWVEEPPHDVFCECEICG